MRAAGEAPPADAQFERHCVAGSACQGAACDKRSPDDEPPEAPPAHNYLASLHWAHWLIVFLSFGLTLIAWQTTKRQAEEKSRTSFERETQRIQHLIVERMERYEDALWGGVSLLGLLDGDITPESWREYSLGLQLSEKYPGINGIGIIRSVDKAALQSFVAKQRQTRPDFRVFPEHDAPISLPITFIEPIDGNAPALGLDVAHEANRLAGAMRAIKTGKAHITGPIVLVQDESHTPGFLFYAPTDPSKSRRALGESVSLVYAPFVMKELMNGVLSKEFRTISLRISDGSTVLYDDADYSPQLIDKDPQYASSQAITMYGREWRVESMTGLHFNKLERDNQPMTILIGGILIDSMLLLLFLFISNSNQKAVAYAAEVTADLKVKARELEASNTELERFAYVASHDLQEPLRMVGSFAELLNIKYDTEFDEEGQRWLGYMVDGAKRMQALVQGLLAYSRIGRNALTLESFDLNELIDSVLIDLTPLMLEKGAKVHVEPIPKVVGQPDLVRLVLQNLISNAIKFTPADTQPSITITQEPCGERLRITVADNGIGIDPIYAQKVFSAFQRLHSKEEYPGTGIGLAIAQKIVQQHQGTIWFEPNKDAGTAFHFTLSQASQPLATPPPHRKPRRARVGS